MNVLHDQVWNTPGSKSNEQIYLKFFTIIPKNLLLLNKLRPNKLCRLYWKVAGLGKVPGPEPNIELKTAWGVPYLIM